MVETKEQQQEPPKPPKVAIGFAGDEAEELGEKLIQMPNKKLKELSKYLEGKIDAAL